MARVNIDGKNNKEWDSKLVDAYMKNQSKQNNNRSTAQSRLPQKPDYSLASQGIKQSSATSRYESIPNYNIVERTFSPRKQYEYEVKQSRLPKYQQEKSNQIGSTLSRAGVTSDDLSTLSSGTMGNSVFQGLDVLNGLKSWKQKNEIAQKVKGTGLSMSDVLDYAQRQNRAKEQENWSNYANEHKIIGTAITFPINAAGGISGEIANTADYLAGKPFDPNSFANSYINMSNAMRGATANDFGKAGHLLYDVGTSIGDSATALAIAGGNPMVAGAIQGANSYTNSIIDAANRGLSPNQIMGTGVVNGLAEGAFEALPLGKLKGILNSNMSKEAGKGIIKSVLSQMANEGASEMTTEGIDQVADILINGGLSNYAQSVDQYQKQGMSESEAEKQAVIDVFKQVGYSGLAGAVSGGIMGGGTALAGRVIGNRNSNNSVQNEINTELITEGETVNNQKNNTDLPDGVHTQEQLNTISEYQNSSDQQIMTWADRKRNGQKSYKYLPVANVNDSVADYVQSKYGIDIHGNTVGLNESSLNHIDNEHINNDSKSPMTNEDLSRIGYVLENPDEVVVTDTTSKSTRLSDNTEAPTILMRKRIDGHYYIVEAVTDAKTKQDVVVTAFIEEVGKESSKYKDMFKGAYHVVNALENSSPTPNVRNDHENSSFDNNIPNSAENVNGTQYYSQKIEGFNDLDKALDRLVGMYKGDENTASKYAEMKSAINEYLQTGNQSAIDKAVTLAAEIDDSMKGHSYTRKGSGKGTAKSQNNRVTTSFTEGEFVDTLMSYGKYLRDAAKKSTENVNQQSNTAPAQNVQQNVGQDNVQVQQNTDQTGNQRMRSYNDTLVNKTDAPQALKNEFIANPDMYTQLSNADTKAKADAILASGNIDSAIAQFRQMIDGTQKDPAAVPLGYNIAKELTNAGRVDEAVQIVRDMSKALTESGQFSQAAAITMLNNDPQAAMRYLVREIDSMNEAGQKKFKDKWQNFEMTDSEVKQFADIDPGDTDAIKAAYENVYDRLRKEYPVTKTEKLLEYRRLSMLLNARTNVRNFLSNAFVVPVRWTADRVTALGEGAYKLVHPDYQSTQSLNPIRSKESRKLASEAFEMVKSELLGDNKYNDAQVAVRDKQVFKGNDASWQTMDNVFNGALSLANKVLNTNFDTESRKVSGLDVNINQKMGKDINPSLLETARNLTYYLLEQGDNVFVKHNFESRMASYLDAQGITDLESIPADAYTLATQEALKATFKDETRLATGLSGVRKKMGVFGDIVFPFTTTPANVAMRGIDYSPLGLINGGIKLYQGNKAKNKVDISNALTLLGQSATGTAGIFAGYALAKSGIIQGALSDDKDEVQWEKSHGKLPFSFKIGDNYYTFDWGQPAAIPLILGATIQECEENSDSMLDTILQGAIATTNAWAELSPLQTFMDIFGGNGSFAENLVDTALEAPLSLIPAQVGAAARTTDTTQRVTYDNSSRLNNVINQAKSKIPGLSQTLPVAYDTWGNPIKRQDSTAEAAVANLLNPGQLGNVRETPIDDEISRLYSATGEESVFPQKAAWKYDRGGENIKLNNEQNSEYQRIMGHNSYNIASAFINSDAYNTLDDAQRAEIFPEIYNFSKALADSELFGYDIASSKTYKKMYEIYQDKGAAGVATFLGIKQNTESNKDEDHVAAVADLPMTDEEKGYYLHQLVGDFTKESQTAYDYNGYAGLYWYYAKKTGVGDYSGYKESQINKIAAMRNGTYTSPVSDNDNYQTTLDKIAAMRNGTYEDNYGSSVSSDMVSKVAAMRNGTYVNQDSDYQARLQRIRDMLK